MIKRLILVVAFLICALPANAAYTRISRTQIQNSGGTAFSVTIPSTAGGNILVVELGWVTVSPAAGCVAVMSAPTDNKSGGSSTYITDLAPISPDAGGLRCLADYSVPNSASGITSVTIHISATTDFTMGFIEEWSGAATSSAFDKSQTNGTNGSTWTSNATATLTGAADLAIGTMVQAGNNTTTNTPTNSFGDGGTNAYATCGCSFYTENRTLAATTGIAATGSLSTSLTYDAAVITYKAPGAITNHTQQVGAFLVN